MSDLIDRNGFRANVGMVLMSDDGQLFLARRAGGRGWQFPQGGMRRGESAEDSLYRELNEEIGLQAGDVQIVGRTRHWLRYRLPQRYLRVNVRPLCLGQKQRWFLLRLRRPDPLFRFDHNGRTGIRPLALGRLLAADPRGHLLQASGLYASVCTSSGVTAFPGGLPPYPSWWRMHAARSDCAASPAS